MKIEHVISLGGSLLLLALLAAPASASESGITQDPIAQSGPTVSLRIQLEKGLRLRRPVEFDFIDRVIKLVDAGTLSRSIVDSTFLWATRKHDSQPYPYFERGLRIRAARAGVEI